MKTIQTAKKAADRLSEIKQLKAKLNRHIRALESEEAQLKEGLEEYFDETETCQVVGKTGIVEIFSEHVPVIEDMAAFRTYISRHKKFELAYNPRPVPAQIQALWAQGKQVPGVGKVEVDKFRVSSVS